MTLGERLHAVQSAIEDAARAADRDPASITTIVVTKFHPAQLVRELHALGVREFGESRHQEAGPKAAELADLELNWHFIGQLQSKKARQVAEYAHVVHSLDRDSLVRPLGSAGASAFVQVNLTDDRARGGVTVEGLDALIDEVLEQGGIRLLGLMTVAPLDAPARPAFARLRELSERVQKQAPDATALSMGMSGDFAEAIAEGATHLRVGTAITGNRPPHG